MSVRIRLKRMGSKKNPFYRIVATDSRMPRDGRFLETLGYYNPMTEPPDIQIHEEVLFKWFDRGATPSVNAESLLRRAGCIQKYGLIKAGVSGDELATKVEAIRNQQEAAAKKKQMRKQDAKSEKAIKKEEAEAEAAAAEQPKAEAAEKPKAEEPKAEAAEEQAAEEPKAQAAEEPAAEEPKAEEVKTEEKAPEQPAAEETKTDEPESK